VTPTATATARLLGDALGVPERQRVVCFQSRLGRTPWIKPYTDVVLDELAKAGKKRLAVVCPAFVADCLETLEEIGIRGRATWIENGGEELALAPAVNASDTWTDALIAIVREHTRWLDAGTSAAAETAAPRARSSA